MKLFSSILATTALVTVTVAAPNPYPPIPTQTLPLKTHVYADSSCSRSRANLYYLQENSCIGPLYHTAGSLRVSNGIPSYCSLTAYSDGGCLGAGVSVRNESPSAMHAVGRLQKVLSGPANLGSCFGLGEHPTHTRNPSEVQGANSFYLRCEY